METYSFITFIGGMLVGLGVGMLLMALAAVIWSRYGDTRK
jgi:hypothetical protein